MINSTYSNFASIIAFGFVGTPEQMREWLGAYPISGSPFMTLVMPCGSRVEYAMPDDVPLQDTPCPCGNPTHWFIKLDTGPKRLVST